VTPTPTYVAATITAAVAAFTRQLYHPYANLSIRFYRASFEFFGGGQRVPTDPDLVADPDSVRKPPHPPPPVTPGFLARGGGHDRLIALGWHGNQAIETSD
jgi:hypothetical protein